MKIPVWCRSLLVAALLVSGGHATETPVTINPELKGAWIAPDGAWDERSVRHLCFPSR